MVQGSDVTILILVLLVTTSVCWVITLVCSDPVERRGRVVGATVDGERLVGGSEQPGKAVEGVR